MSGTAPLNQSFPPRQLSVGLCIAALGLIFLGLLSFAQTKQKYSNTFYPGVTVDGIALGGHTQAEALHLLQAKHELSDHATVITLKVGSSYALASTSAQLQLTRNYQQVLQTAYAVGRTSILSENVWQLTLPRQTAFQTQLVIQPQAAARFVETAQQQFDQAPIEPSATLTISQNPHTLKIDPGKDGLTINPTATITQVVNHVSTGNPIVIATVTNTSSHLSPAELTTAQQHATQLVGKQVVFTADNVRQTLSDQQLISLLQLPTGINDAQFENLFSNWQKLVNRPPQDAQFAYNPQTLKVTTFVAPQNGLELNKSELKQQLQQALSQLATASATPNLSFSLPVKEAAPAITLDQTNTLGIKEQIGFGDSQYYHSIPGRVHNVALTAARINNTIVKPGEEFSFNQTLGDVSAATGFEPAYVIKDGRTELGDGGGVCQVSTTLFRALLNAGLPITKRYAHSYRVSYYELNSKPGVDATVYAGDVDLRFINDTGHNILIHTETDSKNLYMSVTLYGTSDGRSAQIVDHTTWDYTPAPPPLYIDDPSLPRGAIKQIDFAASGIKASFKNVVKDKTGKVIREDVYYSNYQPWRAVYLRGV